MRQLILLSATLLLFGIAEANAQLVRVENCVQKTFRLELEQKGITSDLGTTKLREYTCDLDVHSKKKDLKCCAKLDRQELISTKPEQEEKPKK